MATCTSFSVRLAHVKLAQDDKPISPMRIALITTVPESLFHFLSGHIRLLAEQGDEIHTISSPGLRDFVGSRNLPGTHHEVRMRRTIRPLTDIVSLYRIWRVLRQIRPDIVHTHTPKAGLLGIIASSLAGVPIRIYGVNGLPIRVQGWLGQAMLQVTERIACSLATEVICVSRSVRRFVVGNGFCPSPKCRTLGDGASHGVDTERFNPEACGSASGAAFRKQQGIPEDALLIGYIGRIVPAKGINELAVAWRDLRDQVPQVHLLLCGYCEADHPMDSALLELLRSDPSVHFTPEKVSDMPPVFASLDICVLPTWGEGLPNVVLEACSMAVPTVGTRVPGCVDAIRNKTTGIIVPARDSQALMEALAYLANNPKDRERIGKAARQYVSRRFSEKRVSRLLLEEYRRLAQRYLPAALSRERDRVSGVQATTSRPASIASSSVHD